MSNSSQEARKKAERFGRHAETRAAIMLRLKGYSILDRRWKSSAGEIDLVIKRGATIAFVEVKARQQYEDALMAVGPHQRKRIVNAAKHWLAANPDKADFDCRFDIVVVAAYQWPHHISNAFAETDQ